jgi:hypothetical protein
VKPEDRSKQGSIPRRLFEIHPGDEVLVETYRSTHTGSIEVDGSAQKPITCNGQVSLLQTRFPLELHPHKI